MIDASRFSHLPGLDGSTVAQLAQVARANRQMNSDVTSGTTSRVALGLPPGAYDQEFNADFTGTGLTDLLLYNRQQGSLDVLTFSHRFKQILPHFALGLAFPSSRGYNLFIACLLVVSRNPDCNTFDVTTDTLRQQTHLTHSTQASIRLTCTILQPTQLTHSTQWHKCHLLPWNKCAIIQESSCLLLVARREPVWQIMDREKSAKNA